MAERKHKAKVESFLFWLEAFWKSHS